MISINKIVVVTALFAALTTQGMEHDFMNQAANPVVVQLVLRGEVSETKQAEARERGDNCEFETLEVPLTQSFAIKNGQTDFDQIDAGKAIKEIQGYLDKKSQKKYNYSIGFTTMANGDVDEEGTFSREALTQDVYPSPFKAAGSLPMYFAAGNRW